MYFPFIITFIAGISTYLGYLFTYIKVKNINRFICISLSFASGIMFLISIKELIPYSINGLYHELGIFKLFLTLFTIPTIIYTIINKLSKKLDKNNSLYRVGILSMISLIMHNIPEGIITFLSTLNNYEIGIKIAMAIIAHNIPEGISISVPIYYSTRSRAKASIYTLIAGLSEFLGAILTFFILKNHITPLIMNIILYSTGCLMIIISLKEILPAAYKYKNINYILIGVVLSLIILII